MPLSGDQILQNGLIEDPSGAFAGKRDVSYDLQIGAVILDGKVHKPEDKTARGLLVKPQQTFTIVSREHLHVKSVFVGYAFIKTGVARLGILAINTGIIDPPWHKPLATTAINFSGTPYPIFQETGFLRISFHRVADTGGDGCCSDSADPPSKAGADDYLQEQQELAANFPQSFLDVPSQAEAIIGKAKKEILAQSWGQVGKTALLVTFLALVLAGAVPAVMAWVANRMGPDRALLEQAREAGALEARMSNVEAQLHATTRSNAPKAGTAVKAGVAP